MLQQLRTIAMRPVLRIPLIVWAMVAVYVVVMIVVCAFQWTHYIYGGYDLAIFDQVFWNSAHGRWFEFSFSPYSYLVDHRSLLIPILVPLYWIIPHPMTLLVLQTLVVASGALALYFLSRKILGHLSPQPFISVVIVALYLIQPTVHAMNLFEFHMLPFIIPLSFLLWLAVEYRKWPVVICLFIVILLLREDTALMTAGIGLLLILTKQKAEPRTRWIVGAAMMIVSMCWFVFMMWLGMFFAPDGTSKFIIFYEWMGNTPVEAAQFIVQHPLQTLATLGDYDHSIVVLFLFATVGFLPLFRIRYFIPAVIQLTLFLLINQHMMPSVLKSHYPAVFVPWLCIGALYGFSHAHEKFQRYMKKRPALKDAGAPMVLVILICTIIVAQSAAIGPIWGTIHNFNLMKDRNIEQYDVVVQMVGPEDSVITTSRLYSHFAQREKLTPALHIFTGRKHFSDVPYPLPEDVDWIILEQELILRWGIYLRLVDRSGAGERLQSIIEQSELVPVMATEDLVVFGRPSAGMPTVPLVETSNEPLDNPVDVTANQTIHFDSWEYEETDATSGVLSLLFDRTNKQSVIKNDQHIQLTWKDERGQVIREKIFALGFGLHPTYNWEKGTQEHWLIHQPIVQPANAASVELHIGPLDSKFGPFFTLWVADPILKEGDTISVPLRSLAPLDQDHSVVASSGAAF